MSRDVYFISQDVHFQTGDLVGANKGWRAPQRFARPEKLLRLLIGGLRYELRVRKAGAFRENTFVGACKDWAFSINLRLRLRCVFILVTILDLSQFTIGFYIPYQLPGHRFSSIRTYAEFGSDYRVN